VKQGRDNKKSGKVSESERGVKNAQGAFSLRAALFVARFLPGFLGFLREQI